jgi:hypothetical protein
MIISRLSDAPDSAGINASADTPHSTGPETKTSWE